MSAAEKLTTLIPTTRVIPFNRVSEKDYFALDLAAETRLEYYDGEIVAMADASPNHSDIAGNVFAFLHGRLRGSDCRARMSEQRVHVPARRGYVYPDVVVGCGKLDYQPDTNPPSLLNPVLIIEVLSESTERFDRGRKFETYQSILTLRYYLLLDSTRVSAHLFAREPGALVWTVTTFNQLTDTLPLPALSIELPLAAAYAAVVFEEGGELE